MTLSVHRHSAVARLAVTALATVATGLGAFAAPTGAAGGAAANNGTAAINGTGAVLPATLPVAMPEPQRDDQWQLAALHAETAWQYATGRDVVVGVLDSGVDAKHPDLAGRVLPGLDLVSPARDGRHDPVGHGTTVAGLIAGSAADDRGVVGLAPQARILPVRVLNAENRYEDATVVAQGVRWAVDHGARVLNLSLGGIGASTALAEALDYAFAKDVVVVACTGNVTASTPTEVWYPAREPGVLAVSGLDRANGGVLWANSITGPETVISAPATALIGARPNGYWRVQGTSFAAPLVTATAALIRSRWPDMSAGNVVNRLIVTARDVGPAGRDESYGFGAVDPVAALTRVVAPVSGNPLDNAPPPGRTGFGPAPGTADDEGVTQLGAQQLPDASQPQQAGGEGLRDVEPVASSEPPDDSPTGGLLGGVAAFAVLVTGSVLLARRFET